MLIIFPTASHAEATAQEVVTSSGAKQSVPTPVGTWFVAADVWPVATRN